MTQLQPRRPYADLPEKLYFKTADNETDHLRTEPRRQREIGASLGYEAAPPVDIPDLTPELITRSTRTILIRTTLPIWQIFIDSSNGQLTNNHYGKKQKYVSHSASWQPLFNFSTDDRARAFISITRDSFSIKIDVRDQLH